MKRIIIATQMAFALLVSPIFAGNETNYTYLALGDSVPFGMNILLLPPYATQFPTPEKFIGYPEIVAGAEHLLASKKEVNASCPGETSGSFLNTAVLDNGCNSPHYLPPPFPPIPPAKISIGLHTHYSGSQMEFAESQLKTNKHINLVTLTIGSNDGLLVLPQLQSCGNNNVCIHAVLNPVLQVFAGNLAQILTRIRAVYQGPLILMKYYSPDPALDGLTMELNDVITQVATQLATNPSFAPVSFADGLTAFKIASAAFGYDACRAGLLTPLPPVANTPPCDMHPSLQGQAVLAATIEAAKSAKHW